MLSKRRPSLFSTRQGERRDARCYRLPPPFPHSPNFGDKARLYERHQRLGSTPLPPPQRPRGRQQPIAALLDVALRMPQVQPASDLLRLGSRRDPADAVLPSTYCYIRDRRSACIRQTGGPVLDWRDWEPPGCKAAVRGAGALGEDAAAPQPCFSRRGLPSWWRGEVKQTRQQSRPREGYGEEEEQQKLEPTRSLSQRRRGWRRTTPWLPPPSILRRPPKPRGRNAVPGLLRGIQLFIPKFCCYWYSR